MLSEIIKYFKGHELPMNTFGTVCCPVSLSSTFCICGPWGPVKEKKKTSLTIRMFSEKTETQDGNARIEVGKLKFFIIFN